MEKPYGTGSPLIRIWVYPAPRPRMRTSPPVTEIPGWRFSTSARLLSPYWTMSLRPTTIFATVSSRRSEELQFVRDYLALQRLRYGDRMHFHIEGDDETVRRGDCPPLLLQPLIENALRHDLDCHGGPSDIRLSFERNDESVLIRVSNPVSPHVSPNPGTGLGLHNTRTRLKLASAASSLHTELRANRFCVEIRMPLTAPD